MIIICWLRTIFNTIKSWFWVNGIVYGGHNLEEIEQHDNVSVSICKCKDCGKIDISWNK